VTEAPRSRRATRRSTSRSIVETSEVVFNDLDARDTL
jgi:hypothetical protein